MVLRSLDGHDSSLANICSVSLSTCSSSPFRTCCKLASLQINTSKINLLLKDRLVNRLYRKISSFKHVPYACTTKSNSPKVQICRRIRQCFIGGGEGSRARRKMPVIWKKEYLASTDRASQAVHWNCCFGGCRSGRTFFFFTSASIGHHDKTGFSFKRAYDWLFGVRCCASRQEFKIRTNISFQFQHWTPQKIRWNKGDCKLWFQRNQSRKETSLSS